MTLSFIISQGFACGSLIVTVLSFWYKDKKSMIRMMVIDSICLGLSYLLLGETTGSITNLICLVRNITAYAITSEEASSRRTIAGTVFLILHFAAFALTFENLYNVIPLIASTLSCTAYFFIKKEDTVRIVMALSVFVWLIFDIVIGSYVSILAESISCTSAFFAIIKYSISKNDNNITPSGLSNTKAAG